MYYYVPHVYYMKMHVDVYNHMHMSFCLVIESFNKKEQSIGTECYIIIFNDRCQPSCTILGFEAAVQWRCWTTPRQIRSVCTLWAPGSSTTANATRKSNGQIAGGFFIICFCSWNSGEFFCFFFSYRIQQLFLFIRGLELKVPMFMHVTFTRFKGGAFRWRGSECFKSTCTLIGFEGMAQRGGG